MAVAKDNSADLLRVEPSNSHATGQFRDRIHPDISLLQSCWHGGDAIHAPDREYDWARVYDGPLTDSCVMFAVDTRGESSINADALITTVVHEEWVDYQVIE